MHNFQPRPAFRFPPDFLFGTASAGYQVEGMSATADLWEWEQEPGNVALSQRSGKACDWWDGRRWQEDFDLAANDHQRAHRMSVEWSRIEPAPGKWDDSALAYYREIISGLRQRGIEPIVTLHHFANPAWVSERRLWETSEIIPLFDSFTARVLTALGDLVTYWCTFNEPNALLLAGWAVGIFPPRRRNLWLLFSVARNILAAHAAAYRTIHRIRPDALVGLPIHFRPILPKNPESLLDRWAADTYFNLFSGLFFDAIRSGYLRQLTGWPIYVPEVRGTMDFFALNYYTADMVRFDLRRPDTLFGDRSFPPDAEVDDVGFYSSYPDGLTWSLEWAARFKLPIMITENGIGDAQDSMRPSYILAHLHRLWQGIQAGLPILGYLHWSLVDNFEWNRGWTHRFGLYALDPETQVRTPRPSAHMFAEICRTGTITPALVAAYAPQLIDRLWDGAAS